MVYRPVIGKIALDFYHGLDITLYLRLRPCFPNVLEIPLVFTLSQFFSLLYEGIVYGRRSEMGN